MARSQSLSAWSATSSSGDETRSKSSGVKYFTVSSSLSAADCATYSGDRKRGADSGRLARDFREGVVTVLAERQEDIIPVAAKDTRGERIIGLRLISKVSGASRE